MQDTLYEQKLIQQTLKKKIQQVKSKRKRAKKHLIKNQKQMIYQIKMRKLKLKN